jgi:hypothetical protein
VSVGSGGSARTFKSFEELRPISLHVAPFSPPRPQSACRRATSADSDAASADSDAAPDDAPIGIRGSRGPPMSRTSAWSFATARGSVHVAPDELRIRRGLAQTVAESGRALAAGRVPSALRDVGWTGIGAVAMVVPPAVEWLLQGGDSVQTAVGLIGLITAVGGVATSVARERTATVPLRDVDHVGFDEGEIKIVYRDDDDERETETVRPLDGGERSDAAMALRLRGVDLRGVKDDEAVSRTVVDAPASELLA